MPTLNTLPAISRGLGLNPKTLGILFGREDKRGNDHPKPVTRYGLNGGVAIYDVDEVTAWYVARSFDPKPKRGADKQPRSRRTA